MSQKTQTLSLGDHWNGFIESHLEQGRYASASELVRAGLRLLEEQEEKLTVLRATLAKGEKELNQGKGIDGEEFMNEMIK